MGEEKRKNGCGEEKLYFGATVVINCALIVLYRFSAECIVSLI